MGIGNTKSAVAVTSGLQRLQNDKDAQSLYKLVDLHGTGELLTWVKYAMSSGDSSILEGVLEMKVKKYMYNEGRGRLVPIAELVKLRNKERNAMLGALKRKKGKGKSGPNILDNIDQEQMQGDMLKALKFLDGGGKGGKGGQKYREICWEMSQRGAMGENLLHVCLVNGTAVHNELARRLVLHFPKLVNDIFISEDNYGYSALHQAITNEDPHMVLFLLQHGADVHQRCYGAFYCPEDQRASRSDSLEHEWVDVAQNVCYEGSTYYGEYPLSFAACSQQEDCYRLLRAKKADPNLRDTNGNTVLHLMVIHELPHMFDLAYKLGSKLQIANNQNLTPLTLAAKLAKAKMFAHVLMMERQVEWTYGGVVCSAYPLSYIDSINPQNGELNRDSALALILYGETREHLDLIDGLMEELLNHKWKAFAKRKLTTQLIYFLLYFLLFFFAFYLRPYYNGPNQVNTDIDFSTSPRSYILAVAQLLFDRNNYLWKMNYDGSEKQHQGQFYTRWGCEMLIVLATLGHLLTEAVQIKRSGWRELLSNALNFPAAFVFKLSNVGVLLMVFCRFLTMHNLENILGLLVILGTSFHFLFFFRGLQFVGPFILMIYKIVVGDMLRFFMIYLIFVLGFSQSFFIIFLDGCPIQVGYNGTEKLIDRKVLDSPFEAVLRMFIMSIGEFTIFYKHLYYCDLAYLGKGLFIVFELGVSVMLINLLIAMMARTYQQIAGTEKEWKRQWARVILHLEHSLRPKDRLLALLKYSRPIGTDKSKRAIVVKWQQTEEEVQQHKRVRRERWKIFREERKFLLRRRLLGEMVDLENFHENRALC